MNVTVVMDAMEVVAAGTAIAIFRGMVERGEARLQEEIPTDEYVLLLSLAENHLGIALDEAIEAKRSEE